MKLVPRNRSVVSSKREIRAILIQTQGFLENYWGIAHHSGTTRMICRRSMEHVGMNDVKIPCFANQLSELMTFLDDRRKVRGFRLNSVRMLQ